MPHNEIQSSPLRQHLDCVEELDSRYGSNKVWSALGLLQRQVVVSIDVTQQGYQMKHGSESTRPSFTPLPSS